MQYKFEYLHSIVFQSKTVPTAVLRVQHGMEISLDKRCAKGLVVALEWTENKDVLMEILTWVEKILNEVQVRQIAG